MNCQNKKVKTKSVLWKENVLDERGTKKRKRKGQARKKKEGMENEKNVEHEERKDWGMRRREWN